LEYHKKSAALKYPPAMAVIGENTQNVQLLAEAAELNAAAACYTLGTIYMAGALGLKKDIEKGQKSRFPPLFFII
jgi:TPR repeat protein